MPDDDDEDEANVARTMTDDEANELDNKFTKVVAIRKAQGSDETLEMMTAK